MSKSLIAWLVAWIINVVGTVLPALATDICEGSSKTRIEPIVIGPGGAFYITDRHHLARALYDLGEATTYCKVLDNLSGLQPDAFWKHMEDSNGVYLKDDQGNVITPRDLPTSIRELRNDPFRSLAGAVREFLRIR